MMKSASSWRASGKQSFHLYQAARHDEALFIIDLDDVVNDLEVHGGREKIFADAFDHVGLGLDRFAALDEIVVQGAIGIDADNFDLGIFFLQIFSHAADGSAGAHAADEMRDLAFAVFPDFGPGGAIVRLRIHGIGVLIGIVGIGDFAREFFRHGIVAARIFGLDRGGADDHFRA